MSLLKNLIEDMAAGATGAHGIATGGGHETVADYKRNGRKKRRIQKEGTLFSGGIVNGAKRNVLKRVINMESVKSKIGFLNRSFLESLGVDHGKNDFDASDVLSKIDAAQQRENLNDDTTAFGLEDDEGNLVKVYVKTDQAEEFEDTLASMLAGQLADNGDPDGENVEAKEIAEIIYELKDKFDIVDVEWPGVETDEEEEQEVVDPAQAGGAPGAAGGEAGAMDAGAEGGAEGDLGLEDPEGGDELGLEDGEGDMEADDDAKSALQAVIDVMKADAEAKMADANAREAEARAKEAEYSAQGAAHKVKREEQVYDMEAAEKDEKSRKKEGEQQAKLARFQHGKAQDAEAQLSFESVEDDVEDGSEEISLTELTNLIFKNLRHQG